MVGRYGLFPKGSILPLPRQIVRVFGIPQIRSLDLEVIGIKPNQDGTGLKDTEH